MTQKIGVNDISLTYASLAEARTMSGLRLITGAVTVPGPWREACKAIFHVKGVPYVAVASLGQDGTHAELREWTGQTSSPVAIWNDERPRSTWIEQLYLAERLQPAPALIPASLEDRALMFGYCNELCGETGFGWSQRLMIIGRALARPAADSPMHAFWQRLGAKYGYTPEGAAAAPAHSAAILELLDARLAQQRARGSRFFIGDQLSALDIYWATFAAVVRPLPPELCPMATAFRALYTESNPRVTAAATPLLLEHRDFIYGEYLELPVVF